MAQFSFIRCPLLVAHCLGMRLVAMSQAKADPRLAVCAFVLVLIAMLAGKEAVVFAAAPDLNWSRQFRLSTLSMLVHESCFESCRAQPGSAKRSTRKSSSARNDAGIWRREL